eukprot:4382499-Pyramimonas_sp.AAC.1
MGAGCCVLRVVRVCVRACVRPRSRLLSYGLCACDRSWGYGWMVRLRECVASRPPLSRKFARGRRWRWM